MSATLLRLLRKERSRIVSDLENSLAAHASFEIIRESESALLTVEKLIAFNSASRYPVWLAPVFVVGIAVAAIGLAAVTRIQSPRMVLDALATTITLSISREGLGLINEQEIPVDSILITGDALAQRALAGATRISRLKFAPGSAVIVSQEGQCFNLRILGQASSVAGIRITAVLGEIKEGRLPTVGSATLHPGSAIRVCSKPGISNTLVGGVERIDLSRLHETAEIDGKIRTASIKKGSLQIPVIGKQINLSDNDQILLENIADGWLHIGIGPDIRIAMTGRVGTARNAGLVKARPDEGVLLAPTILDWVTNSSVTGFVGVLTGLIGMIWSAAKYFGYRSS